MAVLSQSFDPDLRPEWVGRAARAWDIGPVIEAIVDADVEAAFPDRREDASFVAMLEKSITANLGQFRRFLIGEIALDDMKLESPIEFASMQAQLGISHSALQHSYRTGARVTWAMWAEHLAEAADEEPVPSSESAAGLRWSTAMFLAWYDHVVTSVDAGYTEREYMLRRSGFQFRVDTVRQILAGDLPAPPRDLYPALRYDLSAEHLTIQLTEVSDISTQEITKRLRIASGAADSLEVRLTPSDVVVWLSRPHPWRPEHGDRVVETLIAAGTTASVGTPAVGVEGSGPDMTTSRAWPPSGSSGRTRPGPQIRGRPAGGDADLEHRRGRQVRARGAGPPRRGHRQRPDAVRDDAGVVHLRHACRDRRAPRPA